MKKSVYRALRYNPWVERLQSSVRRENGVSFPEIDLFVPCGPGDIIIDAGANVGDITSRGARTGAIVHAFEPNPACCAILKRRFGSLSNVIIHPVGLMDRDCSLTLSTPKPHDEFDSIDTTVASSFVSADEHSEQTEVRCIDAARFIRELDQPIALLKMDIEGAEIYVLDQLIDAGLFDRIGMTIVETHERFSPQIKAATERLKARIEREGLSHKVRLDWI